MIMWMFSSTKKMKRIVDIHLGCVVILAYQSYGVLVLFQSCIIIRWS